MNRKEAEIKLQEIFKMPAFYDEQWLTIDKLLKGEKVLLIEKTGFGKSLCFQFPATIFEGTTIVFSPLIALMRDQVKKLNSLGINAKCINSEQTQEENSQIINDAIQGNVKILYIAPERQENNEWIEATRQMKLSMVVIDEAHCISVWGHDFRPSFKRIINLVKLLPKGMPILATTATATKKVEEDTIEQIGDNISSIRGNLMRENFKLFVIKVNSEDEKLMWLGRHINSFPGNGILYTGTRVDTEVYSNWFEYLGVSSTSYNAGLDSESRVEIENGLMSNRWKCIISTNALGMGIDKPDIRFIIHTQIPQSLIHYYQEIGRAGRDGETSYVILFYNPADKRLPEAFIEGGRPSISKYERVIDAIKNDLLGESDLMKATNLKLNQVRVIKSDLIEQGIIREVLFGRSKKYEYIANSKPLDNEAFEELKIAKLKDLDNMISYVETDLPRMKFLCDYLGDNNKHNYEKCDNTSEKKISVKIKPEWQEKLKSFREDYFPVLEVETKGSKIVNGIAASFYSVSNVGNSIYRSKYEKGGDFPDFIFKLFIKAFSSQYKKEKFDLIVYIPPSISGNLVRNFAIRVSERLNIPISHNLIKTKVTKQQKEFENHLLKAENVKDAFTFKNPSNIKFKNILLIDDILDSGSTIKAVGKYLSKLGASKITPIVIAKAVGGDKV